MSLSPIRPLKILMVKAHAVLRKVGAQGPSVENDGVSGSSTPVRS